MNKILILLSLVLFQGCTQFGPSVQVRNDSGKHIKLQRHAEDTSVLLTPGAKNTFAYTDAQLKVHGHSKTVLTYPAIPLEAVRKGEVKDAALAGNTLSLSLQKDGHLYYMPPWYRGEVMVKQPQGFPIRSLVVSEDEKLAHASAK